MSDLDEVQKRYELMIGHKLDEHLKELKAEEEAEQESVDKAQETPSKPKALDVITPSTGR